MLRMIFMRAAALTWLLIFPVLAPGTAAAFAAGAHPAAAYFADVAAPGEQSLQLYVEEWGHGSPVVLIHGLGGSTYSWRFIVPVLARNHRVIALDLKGFGRSAKVFDTNYSARDQSSLIARFLARRHLAQATLIGHSFGGQVAMMTALSPEGATRISSLVLIDVPALPQRLSPVVAFMQQPVLPYALMTAIPAELLTRISLRLPTRTHYARDYTAADADAYAEPFSDAAARHAYIQTARQIVPGGLSSIVARYRAIRQRTLLVWCEHDEIVPVATGHSLTRILSNAHLVTLAGCNHSPPDEAPGALAAALTTFLTH